MKSIVNLYSSTKEQLSSFLKDYYNIEYNVDDDIKWECEYDNPIKIAEIIGIYIDNKDKYNITMWISIDPEVFINVNDDNADEIIKYLYERFPNK